MKKLPREPKPYYFKKNEFLIPLKEDSVNQDVIDELVKITKEGRKLEEKLLKKRVVNGRVSL